MTTFARELIQEEFGESVRLDESLARYTSARVGGPADVLLTVASSAELVDASRWMWENAVPFLVIGGGSNVLVSDAGYRGVIILNQAKAYRFIEDIDPDNPQLWAESGVNFGVLARTASQKGFSGLEWAAGIPGTVGGAVVGNAGAHGEDVAQSLVLAGILQQDKRDRVVLWQNERLEYSYRTSYLKRRLTGPSTQPWGVVIDALFQMGKDDAAVLRERLEKLVSFRRRTQPPGASMGSMFINPPGDYAGRLIEQAGLKGTAVGKAEISSLHANFFTNLGGASARDVRELIEIAQKEVENKFGVRLELEIELIGEWI